MLRALVLLLCVSCTPPDDLTAVQLDVNRRIVYKAEPKGRDLWIAAEKSGDCEDYALAKRLALLARGYAADRLEILVAFNPAVEGLHAVLVVDKTTVLDNNETYPVTVDEFRAKGWRGVCVAHDLRPIDLRAGRRC